MYIRQPLLSRTYYVHCNTVVAPNTMWHLLDSRHAKPGIATTQLLGKHESNP